MILIILSVIVHQSKEIARVNDKELYIGRFIGEWLTEVNREGGSSLYCITGTVLWGVTKVSNIMYFMNLIQVFKYKSFTNLKKRVLRFLFYVSWIIYDITLVSNLIVCECIQFLCVIIEGERGRRCHMWARVAWGNPSTPN